MNIIRPMLVLVPLVLLGFGSPVFADDYLRGSLIGPGGKPVEISRISARGTIAGEFRGRKISFAFSELQKIENLGEKVYRVTTAKGQIRMLEKVELRTPGQNDRIIYWSFDPRAREERRFVLGSQSFHTLAFTGAPGRLKANPRTGGLFPPDYLFDPFTGEKLQWHEPGY